MFDGETVSGRGSSTRYLPGRLDVSRTAQAADGAKPQRRVMMWWRLWAPPRVTKYPILKGFWRRLPSNKSESSLQNAPTLSFGSANLLEKCVAAPVGGVPGTGYRRTCWYVLAQQWTQRTRVSGGCVRCGAGPCGLRPAGRPGRAVAARRRLLSLARHVPRPRRVDGVVAPRSGRRAFP
jgi:hypothetical protein